MTTKLKLEIRLGRYANSDRSSEFYLEIMDVDSRCEFVKAEFDAEQFANLMSTRLCECFGKVDTDLVGTEREHKIIAIPLVKDDPYRNKETARKALAPFEVDGWVGRVDDYTNPHKWHDGKAHVVFERHVRKAKP